MSYPRKLVLLGATGSIGKSTLQVIRKHPEKLKLIGASANSRAEELFEIASEFDVQRINLTKPASSKLTPPGQIDFSCGEVELSQLASWGEADLVVVAVVGAAGLAPTLAALEAGKDVILANKESLVVGGKLVMETAKRTGAQIIPADSEHNAVFQCLHGQHENSLDSIALTASGGPFRDRPLSELDHVTPKEATNHPNWSMGPKITVDSATMANKGLELIEAQWLFNLPPEKLNVLIHPPSLVHAIVRFTDGCSFAQISPPCMTFALQNSLLYPERSPGVVPGLDLSQSLELSFYPPDMKRYPCLRLARKCMEEGKSAPLVFNAANEIAVEAFLANRIGFTRISDIIENTLNQFDHQPAHSLKELLGLDNIARDMARDQVVRAS